MARRAAVVIALACAWASASLAATADGAPGLPPVVRSILHWVPGESMVDVAQMKAMHVNLAHVWPSPADTPFYCPPAGLRAGLEGSWRRELDALHAAGIRAIASVSSIGFNPKVFARFGLDPERYHSRDSDGKPQPFFDGAYGPDYHFSCYNNPGWMALLRESTLMLVDAGFDGIWYDVLGYASARVLYCQCEHCRAKWRADLAGLGPDPGTPLPTRESRAALGLKLDDRVGQAHLRWRWRCWDEAWGSLRQAVRERHPEFAFGQNGGFLPGGVSAASIRVYAGTDLYDYVHLEEFAHSTAPYSVACSLLMGRAIARGKPVMLVQNDVPPRTETQHRIALAEAYAAGGCLQNYVFPEATGAFFDFVRRHERHYAGARSVADVAVVLSWWSKGIYEDPRGIDPAYWFGQMLLDLHVPFDYLIAERDLKPEVLARYRAVALPDLACMTDDQIRQIRAYLRKGGSVVAAGNTGAFDESLRPRKRPGLVGIAGGPLPVEQCALRNPSFEEVAADAAGRSVPAGWRVEERHFGNVEQPSAAYGWPAPDGRHVWHSQAGPAGQPRTRISQDTEVTIRRDTLYTLRAEVSCLSAGKGGSLSLYAWRERGGTVIREKLAKADVEGPVTGTFRSVSVTWDSRGSGRVEQRLGVSADVGHGFLDHCTLTAIRGRSTAIRRRVGGGRLVYLPGCPEREHWSRNIRDLARSSTLSPPAPASSDVAGALRWAWRRPLPVEARAAVSTLVLPSRHQDDLVVHLVNLNTCPDGKTLTPDRDIHLSIAIPAGRRVAKVLAISPGTGERTLPGWRLHGGRLSLGLEELKVYTMVAVELEPSG